MVDYKRIPWPDVVVLAGTQTVTAYSYTCCSVLMWVYRNVYEVIIWEGILMKCEECKFCKYDNSIKEFVCSIEPDLPVVARDAKNNCKKAVAIVKDGEKERIHI